MALKLRFLEGVDPRLKHEVVVLGQWLRRHYTFPVHLEVRLICKPALTDFDGTECFLRWWQNATDRPVTAEIAVGLFAKNLKTDGPEVAYPTVVAAIGRALKYYYQVIRDSPVREDFAERWGDRLLDAYVDGSPPPLPWKVA